MKSVGVYIHFPYCPSICNYCNFNKYKLPVNADLEGFTRGIKAELKSELSAYDSRPLINSIYFGGGTPSLLLPRFVEEIVQVLEPSKSTEITLEANPNPRLLTVNRLREFRSAGINRISLGVQSLDDKDLNFFNRDHTARDARESIDSLQSVFNNLSLDFIWGRPGQKIKDWRDELEEISKFGANHLSLYQLTIERGTRLFKDIKANLASNMPSEDDMADFFELTRSAISPTYDQYEISSFSASPEHESKHNKGYWNGSDYIGVGPGAHGKVLRNQRTIRILSPSQWQAQVEDLGHGIKKKTILSDQDIQRALFVTGLRQVAGISAHEYRQNTGSRLESCIDMSAVQELADLGFLQVSYCDGQLINIKTTWKGLAVADKLIMQIVK